MVKEELYDRLNRKWADYHVERSPDARVELWGSLEDGLSHGWLHSVVDPFSEGELRRFKDGAGSQLSFSPEFESLWRVFNSCDLYQQGIVLFGPHFEDDVKRGAWTAEIFVHNDDTSAFCVGEAVKIGLLRLYRDRPLSLLWRRDGDIVAARPENPKVFRRWDNVWAMLNESLEHFEQHWSINGGYNGPDIEEWPKQDQRSACLPRRRVNRS